MAGSCSCSSDINTKLVAAPIVTVLDTYVSSVWLENNNDTTL